MNTSHGDLKCEPSGRVTSVFADLEALPFPAGPAAEQSNALFLCVRSGEGQRSKACPLGDLAEAAARGGVWQLGHDRHFQEETSLTSVPGPG